MNFKNRARDEQEATGETEKSLNLNGTGLNPFAASLRYLRFLLSKTMMRLTGKTAIVTGAAHGIGRAIAGLFAEEGALVLIADIDEAAGEAAAEAMRRRGGQAVFERVDVADEDQVAAAVRRAAELRGGRIDVLCNNAAYLAPGHDVVSAPSEEWEKCF
jgi:NAD(P)-dependent dehydrogenase (short-subunit alcohol dehydrogenase family)